MQPTDMGHSRSQIEMENERQACYDYWNMHYEGTVIDKLSLIKTCP